MRPRSDRRAAFRDRDLDIHQRAGTKIRVGLGENVRDFRRGASPSCSMAKRVHSGLRESKAISRKCGGRRAHTRKKRSTVVGSQTLEQGRRGMGRGCGSCAGRIRNGRDLRHVGGGCTLESVNGGAHLKGAWTTPIKSSDSRSTAPTRGRTCRPEVEAAKRSPTERRSSWGNISTR